MATTTKILGALVLLLGLALAGVLVDLALDGGQVLGGLMGRDAMVDACLPALTESLAASGYAPSDIDVEARPKLGIGFGLGRSLSGHFTFADGPSQTRIDGIMACVVAGGAVHVDFRADALPRRQA